MAISHAALQTFNIVPNMVPLIALEEHFVARAVKNSSYGSSLGLENFPPAVNRKLEDLGAERIEDMDAAGIALQVVSHNPGVVLPLDLCRQANDQLYAEGTGRNQSKRLAAFATLPMHSPAEAADELARCVRDLGFVGALISNQAEGKYYDDESYWPVFARAEELDVPVYLHPTFPTPAQADGFAGNYGKPEQDAIAAYAWGWHSDVGQHVLRLYAAGLFDRYPRLKLVLGHDGEMLPYMIERVERFAARWAPRERDLAVVWRDNFWFTTSGMFTLAPLACLLRTAEVDRVMFSVDYPFETNTDGAKFMDTLTASGMLTPEELEKVAYKNAEKLLRVSVQPS